MYAPAVWFAFHHHYICCNALTAATDFCAVQARLVADIAGMQNKNNPEGHEGPARRFVQFGGGISSEQLNWLVQQLAHAKEAGQRVIVCGHLPLHPDTCIGTCLLWNYEEVLQAIWDASNVVATITGHAHNVKSCDALSYCLCT